MKRIDRDSVIPKYHQMQELLKYMIADKGIKQGERIPSLRELSEHYGLSLLTVRRALEGLVQEGVIRIEHGRGIFVANPPVLDLPQETKSKLIGMILFDIRPYHMGEMAMGVYDTCEKHGYKVIVGYTAGKVDVEATNVEEMLELGVDGLVIYHAGTGLDHTHILELSRSRFPFVLMDRFAPNTPCNYVGSDHRKNARMAVEHLVKHGHRRIAFLGNDSYLSSMQERYQGYLQTLSQASIVADPRLVLQVSPWESVYPDYDPSVDAQIVNLLKIAKPSAVYAASRGFGKLVVRLAKDAQLQVPDDLSVVCTGDDPSHTYETPPITSVAHQEYGVGVAAAQLLIDCIGNPHREPERIDIEPIFCKRQSVSACRTFSAVKESGKEV